MATPLYRFVSRLLIASMLALPYSLPAQAAMIGSDQVVAAAQGGQDAREESGARARLRSFVARADVRSRLSQLGVSASALDARVAALSDQEARDLAGKLDVAPAGGDMSLLVLLVLVVLVMVLFQAAYKR